MTKMTKRKNMALLLVFAAALCLAFATSPMLHSQESDASKTNQKATQKQKANGTKPANSADAPSTAPATSGSSKVAPKDASRAKAPVGKETVWVNTATGIYNKKGARYYGKTKEGKYMPEDEAVQAGYKRSKRN
jgi:hypothetical protein